MNGFTFDTKDCKSFFLPTLLPSRVRREREKEKVGKKNPVVVKSHKQYIFRIAVWDVKG